MTVKVEKPQTDRVIECMAILKKLTEEVGIPAENPSIRVLKKRMGVYWRDGKPQEDVLPLHGYDRNIVYKLPRWSHQFVDLTLKVRSGVNPPRYPEDLEAEVYGPTDQPPPSGPEEVPLERMSNATQSDPLHPSPQE